MKTKLDCRANNDEGFLLRRKCLFKQLAGGGMQKYLKCKGQNVVKEPVNKVIYHKDFNFLGF